MVRSGHRLWCQTQAVEEIMVPNSSSGRGQACVLHLSDNHSFCLRPATASGNESFAVHLDTGAKNDCAGSRLWSKAQGPISTKCLRLMTSSITNKQWLPLFLTCLPSALKLCMTLGASLPYFSSARNDGAECK